MAGNKTTATTNIKYGSGIPTSEAAGKPLNVAVGGPPGPALPGTRWVRGKDGWMLHEAKDPDRHRA